MRILLIFRSVPYNHRSYSLLFLLSLASFLKYVIQKHHEKSGSINYSHVTVMAHHILFRGLGLVY